MRKERVSRRTKPNSSPGLARFLSAGWVECRHDLFGKPLELLEHDRLRRADRVAEADVLHAGVALLEALEPVDELSRRAGEPGARFHEMLDCRDASCRPAAAAGDCCNLIRRQAGHKAQWRKHLHVLFVDRRDLADRLFTGLGQMEMQAELKVL